MVNNFDIKQNRYGSGKINVNKTANLGHNTSFFFAKTKLQYIQLQLLVNHFMIILVILERHINEKGI